MRLVIAGASLAAVRAARSAREAGFEGEILMLGAEAQLPYERPPLSKEVLTGKSDEALPMPLEPAPFYEANRVEIELGVTAVGLDPVGRRVLTGDGRRWPWDRLIIATGASPRPLGIPGTGLEGVLTLRSYADAVQLRERLRFAESVVVIGAGFVGLEVASAARASGAAVTVVERGGGAFGRVAHPAVARAIETLLIEKGIGWRPSSSVVALEGTQRLVGVRLSSGELVPATVAVNATGTLPNIGWLHASGIALGDGVPIDAQCRTNVPGILAAGDVAARWHAASGRKRRSEHYGEAADQGAAAGRNVVGAHALGERLASSGSSVAGIRIQFAGAPEASDQLVLRGRAEEGRFVAFSLREGRVMSAASVGRPRDMVAIRKWLGSHPVVDPALLADESVDLASFAPAQP